jgi:hypothetical protein
VGIVLFEGCRLYLHSSFLVSGFGKQAFTKDKKIGRRFSGLTQING